MVRRFTKEIAQLRALGSYAVVPMDPEASAGGRMASDVWSEIVKDLRRRMPPDDDDRWV